MFIYTSFGHLLVRYAVYSTLYSHNRKAPIFPHPRQTNIHALGLAQGLSIGNAPVMHECSCIDTCNQRFFLHSRCVAHALTDWAVERRMVASRMEEYNGNSILEYKWKIAMDNPYGFRRFLCRWLYSWLDHYSNC